MRRLALAAACLIGSAATASAQGVWGPSAYGGFGGEYAQTPSLYYPFPGMIESRFGTYFNTPVVPPLGADTTVEAASLDAANAAHEGIDPVAKARADADARAQADEQAAGGRRKTASMAKRGGPKTTLRHANNPPPPFRRALPRGDYQTFNDRPAGVPTYTPFARHQTYGQAYGMGPYGSNFYAGWWHGYSPSNSVYAPPEPVVP